MIYPQTKKEITLLVLSQLPIELKGKYENVSIDKIIFDWWQTGRSSSNLRLSEQGMQVFLSSTISHYDFPISKEKINSTQYDILVKKLTKKLACPYYLGVKTNKELFIRLYDSKVAMLINLYGDLHEYLESVK